MKTAKSERDKIISKGLDISGGFGFWGHEIRDNPATRENADRAFIDGLKAKGLGEKEIICFGDLRRARHLGDSMTFGNSYAAMKKIVADEKIKVSEVREICKRDYPQLY